MSLSQTAASFLSSSQHSTSGASASSLLPGANSRNTSKSRLTQQQIDTILKDERYLSVKNDKTRKERLKEIARAIQQVDQSTSPPWHKRFPKTLIDKKLLFSKDPEISIYTASAVADVLRVVAPDHPYSQPQIQLIFTAFFHQFALFNDVQGELFTQLYQLLENITSVKLFSIISESLPHLISDYIDTIYEVVAEKDEFHRQVEKHFADNLILLFEEMEDIDSDCLKKVLDPLARFSKREEGVQAAYDMSSAVLNGAAEHVLTPLSAYINSELARVKKMKKPSKKDKNRRAKLFHIILQLNNINTKLLLYIMPNICEQLKDENINIRLPVVQLMGKMFASKESYLHRDYQQIFEGIFLHRFADIDANIRLLMCKFAGVMIGNHISTRDIINSTLSERIRDPDERVRKQIVDTVCDIAESDDSLVSVQLMKEIAGRCRDKKTQLRLHAMNRVAKLYQYAKELELKSDRAWNDEQLEKYNWIPLNIMQYSVTMPDSGHRMFTEMLLYDDLLPLDAPLRTQTLFDIYTSLSSADRKVFERIVERKAAFRNGIRNFINASDAKRKQRLMSTLSDLLPDKKVGKAFWKKYSKFDDSVTGVIQHTLDDVANWEQVNKIKSRLSKIKSLSEDEQTYLDYIVKRTSMNLLTQEQISVLFKWIVSVFEEEEADRDMARVYDCLAMVLHFAEQFPELINSECRDYLTSLMEKKDERMNVACLKILHRSSSSTDNPIHVDKKLEKQLVHFIRRGTSPEAQYACECIAALSAHSTTLFENIYSEETRSLDVTSEQLPCILTTLSFIAKTYPTIYKEKALMVMDFVIDEVLLVNQGVEKSAFYAKPSNEVLCKKAAIQLLVSHLDYLYAEGTGVDKVDQKTDSQRIISILFGIVKAKGDTTEIEESLRPAHARGTDMTDDQPVLDKISQAHLRLAAGVAILDVATRVPFHALVSKIQNICLLAEFARDPNMHVRQDFATSLMQLLSKMRLTNKFYALLLLFVGDDEPNIAQMARKYTALVFKSLKSNLQSAGPYNLDSKGAISMYPEYILPTLILLLSRWPNFDNLYPHFLSFQKILFAYFDEVTQDFDNYSFFLQLFRKIKQRRDVDHPNESHNLLICDMALSVLNNCAENRNFSTLPFPGKIFIPPFFVTTDQQKDADFRTLYLPQDFKLAIRGARSFTPKKKSTRSPSKTPGVRKRSKRSTTGRKRKRKPKSTSTETPEPVKKRKRIARSAKSSRAGAYKEMDDDELEALLEEENEASSEEENRSSGDEMEDEGSSEEEEEETKPKRRRRRAL